MAWDADRLSNATEISDLDTEINPNFQAIEDNIGDPSAADGGLKDNKFGNGGYQGYLQTVGTTDIIFAGNCKWTGSAFTAFDTARDAFALILNNSNNALYFGYQDDTSSPWVGWDRIVKIMDDAGRFAVKAAGSSEFAARLQAFDGTNDYVIFGFNVYYRAGTPDWRAGDETKPAAVIYWDADNEQLWAKLKSDTSSVWTTWDAEVKILDNAGSAGKPVAFSVHKNNINQTIPDNTVTKVTWSTKEFDTNSDFASDRFTPTVAGKYQLNVGLTKKNSHVSSTLRFYVFIYKNGVSYKTSYEIIVGQFYFSSANVAVVVDANGSTDYFEVYTYHLGTAQNEDVMGATQDTYFSGHRIAYS